MKKDLRQITAEKLHLLREQKQELEAEISAYLGENIPFYLQKEIKEFITGTSNFWEVDLEDLDCWPGDEKRRKDLLEYASNLPGIDLRKFRIKIADRFAPRHYAKMMELCDRHLDSRIAEEDAISDDLYAQREAYKDPFEEEEPGAEIQRYSDFLILKAFKPGIGDTLPRGHGRKYIGGRGDICWQFSLSALRDLKAQGYPIIDCTDH